MTIAPSSGLDTDHNADHKAGRAPRLLFVVSEDWYFLSHRLPMARAARDAGFEVHVAANITSCADAIARERFTVHPIRFARGRLSPQATLATMAALRRVQRTVNPAITHHVSLQPAVLGLLAALGRSTATVNSLTGLGYAFTATTSKARILRRAIGMVLRPLLNRETAVTIVQNPDDFAALTSVGVASGRIVLVRGSGVDIERLRPLPEPDGPPTVAFAGRLLADKGIHTLVAAHRMLRSRGSDIRLLIAGTPDPANPASVTEADATAWNREPGITWLGHVADIAELWARAHVAVLPSRREGLPLSLLEAAACGRAMVATDVPGCRQIVVADRTGLLVPADDAAALAGAIERLAGDAALRARYAAGARQLVVEQFSAEIIGRQTVAIYRRLLNPHAVHVE